MLTSYECRISLLTRATYVIYHPCRKGAIKYNKNMDVKTMASMGGNARRDSLSDERRKEISKMGVEAKRAKKLSTALKEEDLQASK